MWSGKTAGEIYLYAGDPHFESRRQLPRIAFPVDPALAVRFVQGEDIHFDWYIVAEDATPERVDNARTAIKKRLYTICTQHGPRVRATRFPRHIYQTKQQIRFSETVLTDPDAFA